MPGCWSTMRAAVESWAAAWQQLCSGGQIYGINKDARLHLVEVIFTADFALSTRAPCSALARACVLWLTCVSRRAGLAWV